MTLDPTYFGCTTYYGAFLKVPGYTYYDSRSYLLWLYYILWRLPQGARRYGIRDGGRRRGASLPCALAPAQRRPRGNLGACRRRRRRPLLPRRVLHGDAPGDAARGGRRTTQGVTRRAPTETAQLGAHGRAAPRLRRRLRPNRRRRRSHGSRAGAQAHGPRRGAARGDREGTRPAPCIGTGHLPHLPHLPHALSRPISQHLATSRNISQHLATSRNISPPRALPRALPLARLRRRCSGWCRPAVASCPRSSSA
jgi:hypothetical protein